MEETEIKEAVWYFNLQLFSINLGVYVVVFNFLFFNNLLQATSILAL